MQRGYVLCDDTLSKVLCLTPGREGVQLNEVDSTQVLNKALCLEDLTETKNILRRLQENDLVNGLEIVNVARLYKKFF
jgi:hypothetical protein